MVQLAQNIGQKQVQSLAMTQALQQSLKMLQMSSIDLSAMINAELDKNPFLTDEDGSSEQAIATNNEHSSTDLTELKSDNSADVIDHDYSSAYENSTGGNRNFDDNEFEIGSLLEDEKDLRQDLTEQLCLNITDNQTRMIGIYMMDFLDDAGYFTGNIKEIAANLGIEEGQVEETLKELQKLEPAGIFARTLEECLRIQLADKDRLDPCMFTLLSNLQLLGLRRFDTLMGVCGVDEEELEDMIAEIKSCNPKPALGYNKKEYAPAQPDVYIKRKADGAFSVELNNGALPKVLVNKRYYEEVADKAAGKQEKQFMRENMASANFMVRALDSRANTMVKTAAAIVRHQEEFFKFGIKYLKPLTLAQIADEVGLHESTISRVTTAKYMQTPRGSFEMKYFFTSGVSNAGGEVASTSVKEQIKEMVEKEDKNSPLSDDVLAKNLAKRGVKISRRTVMKYREAMGVASSYERKKSSLII